MLSEKELIVQARSGDHDAFKTIIQKYENLVAATVIGMIGPCAEAEDIGQETFIRFYRSLDRFRGEASVGTYLTRIAINLSLNELRKRKRMFLMQKPEETISNMPDRNSSKDRNDAQEVVHKALKKLEPKFRAVTVLRLINGYSTKETAKILNLPVGTVLSRLARAQIKLKEILIPLIGGTP